MLFQMEDSAAGSLDTTVVVSVMRATQTVHWRNHRLLRSAGGWTLSPVFDVNPAPVTRAVNSRPIAPHTSPDDRRVEDLLEAADAFQLTSEEAGSITAEVGASVAEWPSVARALGVDERELAILSSAFDESRLESARDGARASSPSTFDLGERSPTRTPGEVWVSPHRRNGKEVAGHWRAAPRLC
jgi:serine/threonine-protein kinase HipA